MKVETQKALTTLLLRFWCAIVGSTCFLLARELLRGNIATSPVVRVVMIGVLGVVGLEHMTLRWRTPFTSRKKRGHSPSL
jgi:hypothetical protein